MFAFAQIHVDARREGISRTVFIVSIAISAGLISAGDVAVTD
jgi:hypothetical protein